MGTVERLELLEAFVVMDTYVSGLGSVEDIGGGNWRYTFFVRQEVAEGQVRVVNVKLVMSIDALPDAMRMAAMETCTCACENARAMRRH